MKKAVVLLACLLLLSCESIGFYSQAIGGQLSILSRREPIANLVDDPKTDPELRQRLENILAIRAFAESALALPVDDTFSTYVDLERPFVVWNVFATPEFSMEPIKWCYPVAGCVSYRGYFVEEKAKKYAARLAAKGNDVFVGGVAAYSTLGWFSDPVLNTIINREEYRLAALVFHELAHQVVYVPGDTAFNESFATAVELEGLRRWLQETENTGTANQLVARAELEKARQREFAALVESYVPRLESLYASDLEPDAMRQEKQGLFEELRSGYAGLKSGWDGYEAYDSWFAAQINNARINTVSTYFSRVSAFEALLAQLGNDLPSFYNRVGELSRLPREERDSALAELLP